MIARGDFAAARQQIETAYRLEPDDVEVRALWTWLVAAPAPEPSGSAVDAAPSGAPDRSSNGSESPGGPALLDFETFERRMRARRGATFIRLALSHLDGGRPQEARAALEEARRLGAKPEALRALAQRLDGGADSPAGKAEIPAAAPAPAAPVDDWGVAGAPLDESAPVFPFQAQVTDWTVFETLMRRRQAASYVRIARRALAEGRDQDLVTSLGEIERLDPSNPALAELRDASGTAPARTEHEEPGAAWPAAEEPAADSAPAGRRVRARGVLRLGAGLAAALVTGLMTGTLLEVAGSDPWKRWRAHPAAPLPGDAASDTAMPLLERQPRSVVEVIVEQQVATRWSATIPPPPRDARRELQADGSPPPARASATRQPAASSSTAARQEEAETLRKALAETTAATFEPVVNRETSTGAHTGAVTGTAGTLAPAGPPAQAHRETPPAVGVAAVPALESSGAVATGVPTNLVGPAGSVPVTFSPVLTRHDIQALERTLRRYESAYRELDARAAKAVWPSVNERALSRAFDGLASQDLTLERCNYDVAGQTAVASCSGRASYVPRVGNRSAREEPRQWTFRLRRAGESWKIETAETRSP